MSIAVRRRQGRMGWTVAAALALVLLSQTSCAVGTVANERAHVIAVDGRDRADCTGGDARAPWRTLAGQYRNGCIRAGAIVHFRAGRYRAKSDVFNGRLNVRGAPDAPIVLRPEPGAASDWPVVFAGAFTISDAVHLDVDGIDFVREKKDDNIIAIGANYITIRNSRIHGLPGDYNENRVGRGDCVKVAGATKRVRYVRLINNDIYECPQDAIDITGREDIEVRGNRIHDAWFFQIKGGSQNIVVADNDLYSMRYGISGNGMDCSKSNYYCGSPLLPSMAVEERYEARNVSIIGNRIRDILIGRAIDVTGWQNVLIEGNTIERGNLRGGPVIAARARVRSAFLDERARRYCEASPERCEPCRLGNGGKCVYVRLPTRNVRMIDNVILDARKKVIEIEAGVMENTQSLCASRNEIKTRDSAAQISIDGRQLSRAQTLPSCHNPSP